MRGNELKALRNSLGLTQKQLAEKLQVARVTVARWELGLRKPSPIEILAIRAVLGQGAKLKRKR